LARTFAVDVLACPTSQGRMKLIALVKDPKSIACTLCTAGEATELPRRSPGRGPPYWRGCVLRRQVLGEEDEGRGTRPRGSDRAPRHESQHPALPHAQARHPPPRQPPARRAVPARGLRAQALSANASERYTA